MVLVARNDNRLASGLLSVLQSSAPDKWEAVTPEVFCKRPAENPQATCIFVPTLRGRDGMLPDNEEADRVFQAAAASGIKKMILLSSALVYGTGPGRQPMAGENYSLPGNNQRICSEWSLLEASATRRFSGRLILTIFRQSLVLASQNVLARRLANQFVVTLPGHDPVLQLLSLSDLAEALLCAVAQDKAGIFNVAPDTVVPLHTGIRNADGMRIPFPRTLQRLMRSRETLEYLRYPSTISNQKIKQELGFFPRKSSLTALREMHGRGRLCHTSLAAPHELCEAITTTAEEPTFDDFGMDKDYIRFYGKTLFKFLSKLYWRIEDQGLEYVPRSGKGVLVGMHRGFMPFDGVMALNLLVQKTGRFPRFLTHPGLLKFPFLANFMTKLGGVVACQESAERVLKSGELLGIFPEGIHGAFISYRQAYKLRGFGRDAFVKLALRHRAPIIPFVTVGSAEIFPIFGKIKSRLWTRYSDWPFIPITPTFPLLPVPLPSKWHTQFLPPVSVEQYPPEAADDPVVVKAISLKVRTRMQEAVDNMLSRRRSIFFGSILERRADESQSKPVPV